MSRPTAKGAERWRDRKGRRLRALPRVRPITIVGYSADEVESFKRHWDDLNRAMEPRPIERPTHYSGLDQQGFRSFTS